jgi:cell division transport system permease protein
MAVFRDVSVPEVWQKVSVRLAAELLPEPATPVVPSDTIAGRALVCVIAIMSFLAALTVGGVALVGSSASEWQSEVAREMTIQLLPTPGHDLDAEVSKAARVANQARGVAGVRVYSKAESERLLEPWLGSGLSLEELPVPRLIVLQLSPDTAPDTEALRSALAAQVANARLDDHRGWIGRMQTMAQTAVAAGIFILILVLAATILSVAFATRGAMASNHPVIEVLHLIGATDRFIAAQFQRHFLLLGLKGGALGGAVAILVFATVGFLGDWFKGSLSEQQTSALFGDLSIGAGGYLAIAGLIVLVAVVTAGTSRLIVHRTLGSMQ